MAQNQRPVTGTPTKAYGNSPKSLKKPQDDFEAEMAAAFAQAPTPTAQDTIGQIGKDVVAAAQPVVDAFDAEMAQAFGEAPAPAAQPTGMPQDKPGALAVDENGAAFVDQIRASLAANDTEKVNFLKKQFGEQNVRYVDGKIEYRKGQGEKFRKFNSTVVNDFITSLIPGARDVVKEVAMIPGEVGGALAGAASTLGIGAIVGAPAGAVAGRIASVPASAKLADVVAEFAGIPQDAGRNKTQEMAIEGVIEAALPFVARIGKGAVKQTLKRIPGTGAYAEKQALEFAKDAVALAPENQAVLDSVRQLRDAGFTAEILNSQINTQSKPLADAVALVKNKPQIQEALTRVSQDAQTAIQDTFRAVVDTAKAAKAPGGRIGEVVKDAAQSIRLAEGREIGALKNKAMAGTKNARIPLAPEVQVAFNNIVTALDLNPQVLGKVTAGDIEARLGKLGINDPGQMRGFVNSLNSIYNKAAKGEGLRISEMDEAIKTVGDLIPAAKKVGGPLSKQWYDMTKSLRQYKNQAIESGLSTDIEKKAFRETNARYGALLESVERIEELADDDIGSHLIVDKLLGGKTAVGTAKDLKAILPTPTWEKLKSDWVEKQLTDFTDAKGGIKAGQLGDYFRKDLGPEFVEILFDGDQKKFSNFKAALTYGQRVAETKLPVTGNIAPDELRKVADNVVTSLIGTAFLKGKALLGAVFGATAGKKEQAAILTLLGNDGFQRYVANLPPKKRAIVSGKVDEMYEYAVRHKLMPAGKTLQQGAEVAKQAIGRSYRQDVRSMPAASEPTYYEEEQ